MKKIFDNEKLKTAINDAIGGDFEVKQDKLSGKIVASDGVALFTSFAYDEGYKVKINGKKAKTFCLNGFLAIELIGGENNIVVDFLPRGLLLGVGLFAFGLALFVVYVKFRNTIEWFNKGKAIFNVALYGIGIAVVLAIYIMPIIICLLGA